MGRRKRELRVGREKKVRRGKSEGINTKLHTLGGKAEGSENRRKRRKKKRKERSD